MAPLLADEIAPAALLETLLDVSLTGIILFRPVYDAAGGRIIDLAYEYLNPAAQQMLRLPVRPAESFLTLFPSAATQEGVFDFYRHTFVSGQPGRHQFNYQHDGLDGYFQLAAQRQGPVLVVSFTDTNDQPRTAAEEALRASQAREQAARQEAERQRQQLYNMFEQAPAMICIFDGPAHTFQFVNPPYQALVGSRPLVGLPIAEAMPELAGQPIFGLLDHVYQTGETFYASEMLVQLDHYNEGRPQLEQRYYNFIYQARYNLTGEIDGILVFAYEVTAQVQVRQQVQSLNEELATINEELRASNEEYLLANTALSLAQYELQALNQELEARVRARTQEVQRLFEQAPQAIVVLRGPRFIIEQANEHAAAIWGRSVAEVLGWPHFEALPEAAGQGYEELLTGVLTSGTPLVLHEVPIVLARAHIGRPDTGYYNILFKPLRNEHHQVNGVVVMWTEMTDQVLARRQVQDLNKELAAINEELTATNEELHESNTRLTRTNVDLDTFIYTASHDLKAPITNIESILLALYEQLPAPVLQDELVTQLLEMLQSTVSRFQTTIAQLTDVSKLQLAHAGPPELVKLTTALEDVRLDLAPTLQAAAAQLAVAIAPDLIVSFSPANLRSIIYNLLSNAVKYRHPDRPPVVRVQATRQPAGIVLTVQDNGLGLNELQQRQLFGLFQRLHTHVEGTGVGLYIVKRLIENAGGTITVASEPEVGTTFTVFFPAMA
jgi:signal transduction histidine kinase